MSANAKFMILMTLFSSAWIFLSACDKGQPAITTTKRPLADCLSGAINFYAEGGSVFSETGCDVSTGRNNNGGVWIRSSDVDGDYSRTLSVWMPPEWLDKKSEGYKTIANEYDVFMKCFHSGKEQKSQNPLQKDVPVDNGCNSYSLTINNVPGFGVKNTRYAPHYSFEALKLQ